MATWSKGSKNSATWSKGSKNSATWSNKSISDVTPAALYSTGTYGYSTYSTTTSTPNRNWTKSTRN